MVWEGSDHLGESSSIFAGAFSNHYSAPSDFCFDLRCADEPINDNPRLRDYNLDEKVSNQHNFTPTIDIIVLKS